MAIFHIKVNVGGCDTIYNKGEGCVLISVCTGNTSNIALSAITASTTMHYAITGKHGDNELWFVAGPSSLYAAFSVAHVGSPYASTGYSGLTAGTLTNISAYLPPGGKNNKCLPQKYINLVESNFEAQTLSPNFLRTNMLSANTGTGSAHYLTTSQINGGYDSLSCYGSNGNSVSDNHYATGAKTNWMPFSKGGIYDYDITPPTPPSTPGQINFETSTLTIINNTNTALTFGLTVGVVTYNSSSIQTAVSLSSVQAAANSTTNASMTAVSMQWPNAHRPGYTISQIKNPAGTSQDVSYTITLTTNIGSFTSSYHAGPHSTSFNEVVPASTTARVTAITIEFFPS